MALVLIRGGRRDDGEDPTPCVQSVEREAARRLSITGHARAAACEAATGRPMPLPLRIYGLQVRAIALALAELDPIPADFRDDLYWPRHEALDPLSAARPKG